MIKYYCDCCEKEVRHLNKFEVLIHLVYPNNMDIAYVDSEGNRVSGRTECIQLCNKCYNWIVSEAMEKFRKIRGN